MNRDKKHKKDYDVLQTIVCDDVRREDNGKDILIGVYNGTMILESVPALLPTLGLRLLIRASKKANDFTGAIIGPKKQEIVKFTGETTFTSIKFVASFTVRLSPMPLPLFGRYSILLGMNGHKPVKIHQFDVLKKGDEL